VADRLQLLSSVSWDTPVLKCMLIAKL